MGSRSPEELQQMGKQLALFILQQKTSKTISIAKLQGFVADCTAVDANLGPPLKDLVSRPSFLSLVSKASSSSGQLQKDALIEEIRAIYTSSTIHSINEFLNGFLDLNSGQREHPAPYTPAPPAPKHLNTATKITSFYVDLPSRLLLLNLLSGGFYSYLWTYRHWRHYKRRALQGFPGQPNDSRITPFWSALLDFFYIIGTARRIRRKMVELGLHEKRPSPWTTFALFNSTLLTWCLESTENLAINTMLLLLIFGISLLSCYQITRLQRFANLAMKHQGEIDAPSRPLNRWDIGVTLIGGITTLVACFNILLPSSMLD